jgi:hypothetical protein
MSAHARDHYDYLEQHPAKWDAVYYRFHRTKDVPWWSYPLAVTLPGAADIYIEKEIEALTVHIVATLNSTRQAFYFTHGRDNPDKKSGPSKPYGTKFANCFPRGDLWTTAYKILPIYP